MAEETLLTASRRIVRFFGIDQARGGYTTEETVYAVHTLRKQVERARDLAVDPGLYDAARAFETRFSIDESRSGGLTSIETIHACAQLDKHVRRVAASEVPA